MTIYIRECNDGTTVILSNEGQVNGIFVDPLDAIEASDELDLDLRDIYTQLDFDPELDPAA